MKLTASLMLVAALSLPMAMQATGQIAFGYNTSNSEIEFVGLETPGTYDLAIRVYGSNFKGNKIIGMEVPVPFTADEVTDASAWMTTKLALSSDGVNTPNVTSKNATIADGVLKVTFDEPYVLTTSGVYVGYSFTIPKVTNEATSSPIALAPYVSNAGFFLHTSANSNYVKWTNAASTVQGNLPIIVYIEGNYQALSIDASCASSLFSIVGEKSDVQISVKNTGANPVSSIDYTMTVDGLCSTGRANTDIPIVIYESTGEFTIQTPACPEAKPTTAKIEITAVNGTQLDKPVVMETQLNVLAFKTVTRPLVEEYTGLWCGYCPRGYITLEQMNEAYGQDFVALAYHGSDDMQTLTSMPNNPSGYPYSYINRTWGGDPAYLPARWPEYRLQSAPANLAVELEWADDTHQSVVAKSTVNFAYDVAEANYRLSMVLVGDEFYHENLAQRNYFSGATAPEGDSMWELFTKAGEWVDGLKYNDVVFANPNLRGEAGSVPASVTIAQPIVYSKTFNLNDIKCLYSAGDAFSQGEVIAQYAKKLHAVVILIDGLTNKVINSAKSVMIDNDFVPAGIETIPTDIADGEVVETTYIDLMGRVVNAPVEGQLYIKQDRFADGSTRYAKVLFK